MRDRGLMIFDMDGVLVDVSESYRETIRQTVEHFTGRSIDKEMIQQLKNAGGWNDDWALSWRLIHNFGLHPPFDLVVQHFQKVFRGHDGTEGLITRERWVATTGCFERLAQSYRLAIFTGRLQEEAQITLRRFAPGIFDPVVGSDNVKALKPDPEGLHQILTRVPAQRVFYFGDTVDDARSALAARISFLGVVGLETPERDETVRVLRENGALAVVSSVNEIEEAIVGLNESDCMNQL